jgi:hypothetical protein
MTIVIRQMPLTFLSYTNRFIYLFVQEAPDSFFYHLQPDL